MNNYMDNRLPLINYILKKYDRNDKIVNDIIRFIIDYPKRIDLIKDLEVDSENKEITNYILLYLNDSITDTEVYNLCLDTAIFASNYTTVINRNNQNIIQKSKILINM